LTTTGTLTVHLASYTNSSVATLGTVGTKSVLNLITPGGVNVLINLGTISLSGGSSTFDYGQPGTITNYNVIAGVGDVSTFPVINLAGASFIAQFPIQGLSNLSSSVLITNFGLLGANNLGGAATLSLTVGGGGTTNLVNAGTIALNGGFIVFNGGRAGV